MFKHFVPLNILLDICKKKFKEVKWKLQNMSINGL